MGEGANPDDLLCVVVGNVNVGHHQDDSFPSKNSETPDADRMVHPVNSNSYSDFYNGVVLESGDASLKRKMTHRDAEGKAHDVTAINQPPLQLNLRKSPSLENITETTPFGHSNAKNQVSVKQKNKHDPPSSAYPKCAKLKATNFPATLLKIGSYTRVAKNDACLVCKCYYSKQKLVWEILERSLKNKIEIQWSNIVGLRARIKENQDEPEILEIELKEPPLFYRERDPQPRKHTIWNQSGDVTDGEASRCRLHYLQFRPGVLGRQYEKLLQCDDRLFKLSLRHYPSLNNPYFHVPVPEYLDGVANMNGFNGEGPKPLQPQMNFMHPINPSPLQQIHPYPNTVSSPYGFNGLTSPTSVTTINSLTGNGFHHHGITNPISPVWPPEMIHMSESPLEGYNLSLPESTAVQIPNYDNLIAHSEEIFNELSALASFSHAIPSDVQFPSADNVMVDGSQILSMRRQQMVDPGLLLRSPEAYDVNICNENGVPYALPISSVAPIQDACGNFITCPADNNSLQYVSEDASSMVNGGTYHSWTYNNGHR